jgi:hypothetical protein
MLGALRARNELAALQDLVCSSGAEVAPSGSSAADLKDAVSPLKMAQDY